MNQPTLAERKTRILRIIEELKSLHPDAHMILNYSNNWELLLSVALSAQSADITVNKVTEKLFKKYPTLDDYVAADPKEFEQDIFSTGFYRNKTKNALAAAKLIKEKFNGQVPDTMDELLEIPGVARKTANIVLGNAFGKIVGLAVDTHVKRFATVHNLTDHTNTDKIELDLMALLPIHEWFDFTYRAIDYGRAHCPATGHDHNNCPLVKAGLDQPKPGSTYEMKDSTTRRKP